MILFNVSTREISKNKTSDIGDSKIEPIDNRKSVENEIEEREGIEQKRINESQNSNVVVEDLNKSDESLSFGEESSNSVEEDSDLESKDLDSAKNNSVNIFD